MKTPEREHDASTPHPDSPIARRTVLTAMGVGSLMLPLGQFLQAGTAFAQDKDALPPIDPATMNQRFAAESTCVLTPMVVEGPYYIPKSAVRADIREGQPGVPLKVRLQVRNANVLICGPQAGAAVSIWQCDHLGFYSGHLDQSPDRKPEAVGRPVAERAKRQTGSGNVAPLGPERYLRGVQRADDNGFVEFTTIFPAWYGVRVPHIHAKVFLSEHEALTTQLFFPQTLVNAVLGSGIYAPRGLGYATNENDFIRRQARMRDQEGIFEMSLGPNKELIATAVLGVSHV